MEKSTHLNSAVVVKETRPAGIVGRYVVMALLISVVVSVAIPGPARVDAQAQPSYRNATFSAGASPSAAKIGDLDRDGRNDIAVVNLQGSLQLFFNNGSGSFERVSMNGLWPATSHTLDVDIGDLNGDGRNDIAVAFSTQTGSVSVLFNQGGRSFSAPVNHNVCSSSNGVAIADLDRDGDNDLADVNQCFKAGILLNNGQGSFAFRGSYGNGYGSKSIGLADFNHDGFKDIAYVNYGLSNITVLLNNRDATFGAYNWYYVGDLPDDLTVGDLDGDGDADIAAANSYYSLIFILLNGGDGRFPGYSEIYAGDTPSSIASADFNGDGLLDLAVTSEGTGRLSIIINRGDYTFSNPTSFSVGQAPVNVAAGILDGDSVPDLVAVNKGSGSITVLLSSAGSNPPPPPPPAAQITLTVSKRSTNNAKLVDLRWTGATGSTVDIYRDGSRIATVSNTGTYTNQFSRRATGTYRYRVCASGSQVCSNEASISL